MAYGDHYGLKHRLIAFISRTFFHSNVYVVRRGLLRGMRRKGGLGFIPGILGRGGHDAEAAFWSRVDLADLVIYDVGAFHGLLTLYFATRCREVYAYEPHPATRLRLEENILLNRLPNVVVRPLGVGDRLDQATLVADSTMPGGATLDRSLTEQIRRDSPGNTVTSTTVTITTLDDEVFIKGQARPDLIKLDIEGFELRALMGGSGVLREVRPRLYIELHGADREAKTTNVRDLRAFLNSVGYHTALHVESNTTVDGTMESWPSEGHLYFGGT